MTVTRQSLLLKLKNKEKSKYSKKTNTKYTDIQMYVVTPLQNYASHYTGRTENKNILKAKAKVFPKP